MTIGIYAIVIGVTIALGPVVTAQTRPEWRLRQPISDVDKSRVLELAARLDIDRPHAITGELIHHPGACEALRIESVPAVAGNRRTWQRVWVTNTNWRNSCHAASAEPARIDTWVVADRAGEVGAWRVQDRDGFVLIETPPTIPFAVADAVVRAISTNSLVNRVPPGSRGITAPLPKVDARAIYLVWHYQSDPSLYRVWFRATNVVLLVAVRGTRVELRGWMTEMS